MSLTQVRSNSELKTQIPNFQLIISVINKAFEFELDKNVSKLVRCILEIKHIHVPLKRGLKRQFDTQKNCTYILVSTVACVMNVLSET